MLYWDHGLGKDFTEYKFYYDGNQDSDAITYLSLANKLIHQVNPNAITIAEDMSGMPGMCLPISSAGFGFDYRLCMGVPDMWIKLIKEGPIENWNMFYIWHELTGGRNGEKTVSYDKVAICTGGKSYTKTGSDGDGYIFAKELGINVIEPKPSLVPLETKENWPRELMGLSLKNVRVSVFDKFTQKEIYSDFGEMLFTHFGLSGPTVLSASCHMKPMQKDRYIIRIDLKPALDEKTLDNRLLNDFEKYKNKDFVNSLSELLPQKLIPVFVRLTGIMPDKKVNSITKAERQNILKTLKNLECTVSGYRPIEEAIITSGGIDVKELDPKTMESKKIKNLYFAGEVIDVDAYTGGFNLQIAFSTANLAAINMASN
jgi:predicted Rossmann fold flavoprotein